MRSHVFALTVAVSIVFPTGVSAMSYQLAGNSTDPSSVGDFNLLFNDVDNDNLFNLNELVNFSGVTCYSACSSTKFLDQLTGVPSIGGIADGTDGFWFFENSASVLITTANTFTYRLTPVSSVPLPAALPLLLSSLGGFGLMAWRRRRVVTA